MSIDYNSNSDSASIQSDDDLIIISSHKKSSSNDKLDGDIDLDQKNEIEIVDDEEILADFDDTVVVSVDDTIMTRSNDSLVILLHGDENKTKPVEEPKSSATSLQQQKQSVENQQIPTKNVNKKRKQRRGGKRNKVKYHCIPCQLEWKESRNKKVKLK
jgi:hypothetical protein